MEASGDRASGDIGIDIEDDAVGISGEWRDDGNVFAGDGGEDGFEMQVDDLSDEAEVDGGGFAFGLRGKFLSDEDLFAVDPDGVSTEGLELGDNSWIDDGV